MARNKLRCSSIRSQYCSSTGVSREFPGRVIFSSIPLLQ